MTSDLITWLRAQLDCDERAANNLDELANYERNGIESTAGGHVVDYLDRFSSDRALAEVDAERRILDLHAEPHECPEWDRALGETCTGYYGDEGCPTLRLLALPFADRPGYQEEWKP